MKKYEDGSFKRNDFLGKSSIILMILFINVCLMVPIWQCATNSQLKRSLAEIEALIKETEESKMVVTASIAAKMTPEYLVEQSAERNIVFKQIGGANQVGAVASANTGANTGAVAGANAVASANTVASASTGANAGANSVAGTATAASSVAN